MQMTDALPFTRNRPGLNAGTILHKPLNYTNLHFTADLQYVLNNKGRRGYYAAMRRKITVDTGRFR